MSDLKPKNDPNWKRPLTLGITMVVNPLIFGGLGYWADLKWDTKPWLMLAGLFFGILMDSWEIYKLLKYEEEQNQ